MKYIYIYIYICLVYLEICDYIYIYIYIYSVYRLHVWSNALCVARVSSIIVSMNVT